MISNVCPGLRISQWQHELQVPAIPDTHTALNSFLTKATLATLSRGEKEREQSDSLQFSLSEDLDSHSLCHNKLHGLDKCFLAPQLPPSGKGEHKGLRAL